MSDNLRLIVRVGDAADYEDCDQDLNEVVRTLNYHGVRNPIERCKGGITAPGYERNNYITLGWGTHSKEYGYNFVKPLTNEELEAVSTELPISETFDTDPLPSFVSEQFHPDPEDLAGGAPYGTCPACGTAKAIDTAVGACENDDCHLNH